MSFRNLASAALAISIGAAVAGCAAPPAGSDQAASVRQAALLAEPQQEQYPACAGRELAVARAALAAAKPAMDNAITALARPDAAAAREATKWLGIRSAPSPEADAVIVKLRRSRAFADGVTFQCPVQNVGARWVAAVYPSNAFAVILQPRFFQLPETGLISRRSIVVHEVTHFILTGNTDDPEDGSDIQIAIDLAARDPARARNTAANIHYFTEAVAR